MKHERATEEIRERAALYALGALTQHEARGFEFHLQEGCGVCRTEARRFEKAAAAIGLAAEEADAPEYLRDLLLDRIGREPQVSAGLREPAQGGMDRSRKEPPIRPARSAAPGPARRSAGILPWLVAVLFVLLAAIGYLAWKSERQEVNALRSRISTIQSASDALSETLHIRDSRISELEEMKTLVAGGDTRLIRLKGQPATPSNSGTVFWDPQRKRCLVAASFLPVPEGRAYQLWFSAPAAKTSIGLLDADADGRIYAWLRTPEAIEHPLSMIITLEPDSGSESPTGPFCATGRIE